MFTDANMTDYGCVVSLKMSDDDGQAHVTFVAGKSRLAPHEHVTIPRLELTAAVVGVRLAKLMQTELGKGDITYQIDSTTLLQSIANERQRFPVFIANHVRVIRDFTSPDQWRYLPSEHNPADEGSRTMTIENFLRQANWMQGPPFLKESLKKSVAVLRRVVTILKDRASRKKCD